MALGGKLQAGGGQYPMVPCCTEAQREAWPETSLLYQPPEGPSPGSWGLAIEAGGARQKLLGRSLHSEPICQGFRWSWFRVWMAHTSLPAGRQCPCYAGHKHPPPCHLSMVATQVKMPREKDAHAACTGLSKEQVPPSLIVPGCPSVPGNL